METERALKTRLDSVSTSNDCPTQEYLEKPVVDTAEDDEKAGSYGSKDEEAGEENPTLFVVNSRPRSIAGTETGQPRRESAAAALELEETYPEGGLEAWLVVFGSWVTLFASLGFLNIVGVLQEWVSTHQLTRYNEGTIGWIFSVYTFLTFFMGVYIGPIFDMYGPRLLILVGSICLVLGIMLTSICTQYWHFMLSLGVLCGVGTSLLFTPSIAAIGHFFRARRAFATGIAATGGSTGGIVFPLMLRSLFAKVGWGWGIRTLGFIFILACGIGNLLIHSRLPPSRNASPHPDIRIFRNIPFLLTTIGVFLLEFALFIPITYISLYVLHGGFGEAFSFNILPILNAGSVLGRAIGGYWADLLGPNNANMAMVVLSAVACLAVWLPAGGTTAGVVIFALVFGFASGSNISLIPVCIGRLCRTQNYGRYYATCYTVVSVACLIGNPIAGNILISAGGDYWGLIVFTGVVYVASLGALIAAKVSVTGWKLFTFF